jgi:hypothetical protein
MTEIKDGQLAGGDNEARDIAGLATKLKEVSEYIGVIPNLLHDRYEKALTLVSEWSDEQLIQEAEMLSIAKAEIDPAMCKALCDAFVARFTTERN